MPTLADIRFFDPLVAVILGVFGRHLASLSILRVGLGLNGAGFGVLTIGLACLLTAVVVDPYTQDSSPTTVEKLQQYVSTHTHADILKRLEVLHKNSQASGDSQTQEHTERVSSRLSSLAFVISQLSTAFKLGIFFLVPFFVVDILVVTVLGSLGVQGLRQEVVSIPLKLALFVAVDGWSLIVEKLLTGSL